MESWIKYLIQEEGKLVISNSFGLIAYVIQNKECHVTDFHIDEDKRGEGFGLDLAQTLESKAIKEGCSHMTSNIFINKANKKAFARKVAIFSEFGFLPDSANNNVITMIKEI